MSAEREWDAFVAHAGEDKEACVRPLAEALKAAGLRVWFDDFELKVGDSLRRRIDHGLANSDFGIVVLSRNFFEKDWPQVELDGLVTLEVAGRTTILPVWYETTKDEVVRYSPVLAGRNAALWSNGLAKVVEGLLDVVRPTPPAPSEPASAVSLETHGWEDDLVLLISAPWGNHIMLAYEDLTSGNRVTARVLSLTPDDDPFLRSLQRSAGKQVAITWANRTALGRLGRVEEIRTPAGARWQIEVSELQGDLSANVMDPGFRDITADELAVMRARRLLLGESLPPRSPCAKRPS